MNKTTNAGRHATGGKMANTGTLRGGQGAHVANGVGTGHNQKTGVSPASPSRTMAPRAPVLTDQNTSAGAQRIIKRPSAPFENPDGAKNVPTGNVRGDRLGIPYTVPSLPNARSQNIGKPIGCANTSLSREEMAAIGYAPSDTKSSGPIISGNPTRNNERQAGRPGNVNKGTSQKENSRMRQTGY